MMKLNLITRSHIRTQIITDKKSIATILLSFITIKEKINHEKRPCS